MTNEPRASREIHEIRDRIYDEIKAMTALERSAYYKDAAQKMIGKYGLTVICSASTQQGKATLPTAM